MEKPIMLVREEFVQNISNVINQSGLPAFVIEPILKDILVDITQIARRDYEQSKAEYEASLESNETE